MTPASPIPSERPLVRVSADGRVDVVAEQRDAVAVRGDAALALDGATTTVTSSGGRLQIRVPEGVDLVIGTTSGRVSVSGDVGRLSIVTVSGKVTVEQAESTDVRSETGQIEIGQTTGDCRVSSGSGSVSVRSCEHADVATRTGRISLHDVRGAVNAHCTSGRIDIEMATANDVEAETVTGRIAVSLPRGVRAFRAEIGDDPTRPEGADCVVSARSVTGRVDVGNR